jgi:tRNA uridine 5-carbamoylmethylation protein Kti12
MPSHKLIALSGPKNSGKSTLAKSLVAKHPQFVRQRFAEPIKLMLGAFLKFQGATEEKIYEMLDGTFKETPTNYFSGQTSRLAMQTLGTEWRDLVDKNLWTNAWIKAAEKEWINNKSIIVDDLRFIHEAQYIWNLEGIVIQIDRDKCQPGDHPSEKEYLNIQADRNIYNPEDYPEKMLINLEIILGLT